VSTICPSTPAPPLGQLPAQLPALLDSHQAAAFLGLSPVTLRHWHHGDRRPPAGFPMPARIGDRILRYRTSDLLAWLSGLDTGPAAVTAPVAGVGCGGGSTTAQGRPRGRPRNSTRR
jgi:predicted DNA-binding transcriptional regulator AlpA